MKQDFLMELLKHDELASALKKDLIAQIARDEARQELRDERTTISERQHAYKQKTSKAILKINNKISKINNEESNLCYMVDHYGDQLDVSLHISREAIELLVKFMKEYKKGDE